ncbi:TetR/AcrR family transcriptional regulator [Rhizorhabdus argentea]|uniref:TetR/AcrR family transcriptional regulator n=1 Tax=Rhizorhabdus argentea TaxID=1387174 RepID=UPI0030EEA635
MQKKAAHAPTRGADAKEKVILAGEELFGLHGVEGVSLRRIGSQAEQRNFAVVQYHFGDKDTLLRAIVEYRRTRIDLRRRRLFENWQTTPKNSDLFQILFSIVCPIFEVRSESGTYTFARFLNAVLSSPLFGPSWLSNTPLGEFTDEILINLRRLCDEPSDEKWSTRLRLLTRFIAAGAVDPYVENAGSNGFKYIVEELVRDSAAIILARSFIGDRVSGLWMD